MVFNWKKHVIHRTNWGLPVSILHFGGTTKTGVFWCILLGKTLGLTSNKMPKKTTMPMEMSRVENLPNISALTRKGMPPCRRPVKRLKTGCCVASGLQSMSFASETVAWRWVLANLCCENYCHRQLRLVWPDLSCFDGVISHWWLVIIRSIMHVCYEQHAFYIANLTIFQQGSIHFAGFQLQLSISVQDLLLQSQNVMVHIPFTTKPSSYQYHNSCLQTCPFQLMQSSFQSVPHLFFSSWIRLIPKSIFKCQTSMFVGSFSLESPFFANFKSS